MKRSAFGAASMPNRASSSWILAIDRCSTAKPSPLNRSISSSCLESGKARRAAPLTRSERPVLAWKTLRSHLLNYEIAPKGAENTKTRLDILNVSFWAAASHRSSASDLHRVGRRAHVCPRGRGLEAHPQTSQLHLRNVDTHGENQWTSMKNVGKITENHPKAFENRWKRGENQWKSAQKPLKIDEDPRALRLRPKGQADERCPCGTSSALRCGCAARVATGSEASPPRPHRRPPERAPKWRQGLKSRKTRT